jgi:glycine/D-amino acid oxidase-like deaminating enzyme
MRNADVVICGAGIAGISAAYFLTVNHGVRDVVLVDPNPPLSLTSDHSTECYRNWWPGPGNQMVAFMNRSIDLLEEFADKSHNQFHLNRRGYLFLTANQGKITQFTAAAEEISKLGAGNLRIFDGSVEDRLYSPSVPDGYANQPSGADLILDDRIIQNHFPYLSSDIIGALHVRRAGWMSAQQLGMYLLEGAKSNGARVVQARVAGVVVEKGRVSKAALDNGTFIRTRHFINAAGPFLKDVGELLNVDLPVYNELHLKSAIKDQLEVIDRGAPVLIWNDTQRLPWSMEEREILAEDGELIWLLHEMPPGVHIRPEGGAGSQIILMLWEYSPNQVTAKFPVPIDPQYADIVLRGLVKMLPGMGAYVKKTPRPSIDGGYYTRTRENRPLIGKLPVSGAYVIGALSGFGIMAACAAGELLASYVCGSDLPEYAPAYSLERYENPDYIKTLESLGESWQL